jgi:hypothetical protein
VKRETKGSGQLLFVFLEKPLYEVCLIRIKEQVDEKRSSLGRDRSYFVKIEYSDSTKMFSETDIINMLDFLIDNICVMFGGCVFQQIVVIPMGPNN